jgi:hypothetical protein
VIYERRLEDSSNKTAKDALKLDDATIKAHRIDSSENSV